MALSKADLKKLKANAPGVAALLRALGNERRLLILCTLISSKECTAGQLAEAVELSPSAASQHLARMKEEGLVASRREAQTIYYSIADPNLGRVIALLKDIYCG
jgi:ArsR family transcriptional regulator, virulence genes transcriptional regulator